MKTDLRERKRIRFLVFLTMAMLLLAPAPEAQAGGCGKKFAKVKAPAAAQVAGDFDPRAAWRQAGLDPDKVKVAFTRARGGGFDDTVSYEIAIHHDGKQIGEMSVWQIDDKIWRTDVSGVDESLRGKGIGSMMYLLLGAKFFQQVKGERLISPDRSGLATRMWENLVHNGYAKRIVEPGEEGSGVHSFEMLRSSMGPKLNDYVRQIRLQRVERPILEQ
jgi:GNAT superfamily N-acetyltransferase